MQSLSKKIAVVGIGNTLRRDDGIGIIVLESLLEFYKREDIDYFNFSGASFDLLYKIKSYGVVLLIDGINAGLNVGQLLISELKDIEYKIDNSATSTHELSLKDIFEFSQKLGIKTKIYVAGIQVGDTSFGEGLSDALKNKEKDIIKKIREFIDKILCSPP
jgi:hydrogenase maturation protease